MSVLRNSHEILYAITNHSAVSDSINHIVGVPPQSKSPWHSLDSRLAFHADGLTIPSGPGKVNWLCWYVSVFQKFLFDFCVSYIWSWRFPDSLIELENTKGLGFKWCFQGFQQSIFQVLLFHVVNGRILHSEAISSMTPNFSVKAKSEKNVNFRLPSI